MVAEILAVLQPETAAIAVDATLGYGGHAHAILERLPPTGRLLALDVDPFELPRTELRLRSLGFGSERFSAHRTNFAGLPRLLAQLGLDGADCILADLGVSSMQLDDPARGFSLREDGPLDLRMNPTRGQSAAQLLEKISSARLADLLRENADEPQAAKLADALAGRSLSGTRSLGNAVREHLATSEKAAVDLTIRRVLQALRIAVNDEFSALETFVRELPGCLRPGGRVAIVTFHSGEDRRVKKAFAAGCENGSYCSIADAVTRPSAAERRDNPRSHSAKLRWAIRS